MDDHGGSDLSLEGLMDEYYSRPSQIAEWLWCIEYVAKFVKDISCILDFMNMGYQYSNDYGRRINEVLALRILEFMFDPSMNDVTSVGVPSTSEEKIEFDLSLSNTDVLRAILKEIPVPELRAGMPELAKFSVHPFIAHKNLCLPQCALEKLRDVSQIETSAAHSMETDEPVRDLSQMETSAAHSMETDDPARDLSQMETSAAHSMETDDPVRDVSQMETSAAHSMQTDEPVFRDDRSVHMDTCEEELIEEQQVHIGLDQNINEKEPVDEQQVHISLDQNINEKEPIDEQQVHIGLDQNKNEKEPVDEQQVHISLDQNINEKEPIDEQQVHIGLEQNINEKDKEIGIDDEDEPMYTNEKGELIVIDEDTESVNNGYNTDETFPQSSRRCPEDARVKCTNDGTWLISESDDAESDMVKDPPSIKKKPNTYLNLLSSSSQTRPEDVCWKCEKEGTLLICNRSECETKVHKECLNCPVNVDEDGNFLCPMCWYDRVAIEYLESLKLISCAKRRFMNCFPVLSIRSKRMGNLGT